MADATDSSSPDGIESPRLTAVVFTDVVSYSARMQRDEAGTIAAVAHDLDRMRELCAEYGGETLNTMGDGMMMAFASAVQAVRFALTAQERHASRFASDPTGLQHRIGIHLGDVFRVAGGHVAGDGVNIAARLEGKAPIGGVCISQTVYDTVKGKLDVTPQFAGRQAFKNISEPIPVWHLLPGGAAVHAPASRRPSRRALVAGAGVAAVASAAAGGWWMLGRLSGAGGLAGEAKSIAVLPFSNLSDDKESSYFAEGMHEDLLTQLALLGGLKVVSRTSVMEYRKTGKKIPQIADELKVMSLVEGSVRRAGDTVRVTAQLVDGRTDKHVWAAKYDREMKDVFKVQSELAGEIARALNLSLTTAEAARLGTAATNNPQAYDLFLRHEALTREVAGSLRSVTSVRERIELLEKAVALDPAFAHAWAKLAAERARAQGYGQDPKVDHRPLARQALARAQALAPQDPLVMIQQGAVHLHALDDQQGAVEAYAGALKLAPYNIEALNGMAEALNEQGKTGEAMAMLERALAIDGRNAAVLARLAGTYGRYRHFDRVLELRGRLMQLRPDDIDLQVSTQLWIYWKTGAWDTYDAWRAKLPKDAATRWARVRNTDADRAVSKGDYAQARRLIDVDSEDHRRASFDIASIDAILAAERLMTYFAEGNDARVRADAPAALAQLEGAIAGTRPDADLLDSRSQVLALMGRSADAMAVFADAMKLRERSGNQYSIELSRRRATGLKAMLGDRKGAIEDLRAYARRPGFFIHGERVWLPYARLAREPEFLALVADPATNAPLPLDTPFTGVRK